MKTQHSASRLAVVLPGLILLGSLILVGCESVPTQIPKGLSQAELFQRAQDAAEKSNWQTALVYYQTFLDRFPDDAQNGVAAKYEIAFIHYRLGKLKLAQQQFTDVLKMYTADNADQLPQWPKVLADDITKKIDARLSPKAAQNATTSGSSSAKGAASSASGTSTSGSSASSDTTSSGGGSAQSSGGSSY